MKEDLDVTPEKQNLAGIFGKFNFVDQKIKKEEELNDHNFHIPVDLNYKSPRFNQLDISETQQQVKSKKKDQIFEESRTSLMSEESATDVSQMQR